MATCPVSARQGCNAVSGREYLELALVMSTRHIQLNLRKLCHAGDKLDASSTDSRICVPAGVVAPAARATLVSSLPRNLTSKIVQRRRNSNGKLCTSCRLLRVMYRGCGSVQVAATSRTKLLLQLQR